MRKLLIALSALVVTFSACQKEPSFEDPNSVPGGGGTGGGGGGGNNGTKLVRMGVRVGNDTLTSDYTYNASNRITLISHAGNLGGQNLVFSQKFNRSASNVITSYVLKASFLLAAGLDRDTLDTKYVYDAATSRYVHSISRYNYLGDAVADSTVFNYDATGKLTSQINFFNDGSGYFQDRKIEYTYAGNNLASVKTYEHDGTAFQLADTETYEYDSKVNPQQSAADAVVLGMADFYSANNITKRTTVVVDPPETTVTTLSYTYNTNNRPTKAVGVSGSASSTVTYTYQ